MNCMTFITWGLPSVDGSDVRDEPLRGVEAHNADCMERFQTQMYEGFCSVANGFIILQIGPHKPFPIAFNFHRFCRRIGLHRFAEPCNDGFSWQSVGNRVATKDISHYVLEFFIKTAFTLAMSFELQKLQPKKI